jgi:hypothetical protein
MVVIIVLLLLLAIDRDVYASRSPQSVEIMYQEGVVVTSAQLLVGPEPSKYFRFLYMHKSHPQWNNPKYFPEQ